MSPLSDDAPWTEYRRLVLEELRRLNNATESLTEKIEMLRRDDIAKLRNDVTILQVKAGMWGALAGIITTIATLVLRGKGLG